MCPHEIHGDLTWQIQRRPSLLWFAFLDSHFKLKAFTSGEEAKKVRQETTSTTQVNPKSIKEKKSLFAFKTQPLQTISPKSSEITAYLAELTLEETKYTLQFQKTTEAQFHALSKLARKYLALAAFSAPVEQVFSILGKILWPERARMSDHAFEMQMFLKCNGHL